jgi:hypothetical protein
VRKLLVTVILVAAALPAAPAAARIVIRADSAGRKMTFDVRASRVDVNWYAGILRRARHGAELENVVVRIVPASAIATRCGRTAGSCYLPGWHSATIVVPAGRGADVAHLLVHEYGHHIDDSYAMTEGADHGPPGSDAPAAVHWWAARHIARLLNVGRVTYSYRLGWSHSIAEIFAEDYAVMNLHTSSRIGSLAQPMRAVLAGLRADVAAALAAPSRAQ